MKNVLLFCVLFFAVPLVAKESVEWKAEWITVDKLPENATDDRLHNLWLVFRKNFELRNVPDQAVCRIAGDSKYWLYVNGQRLVFAGQLQRKPMAEGTYHDVVDLSKVLKPGRNVVVVLVWFHGKGDGDKPGLLFDMQADGVDWLSNATWKATPYTRFDATDPVWKNHPYSAYERITAYPQPSDRFPESNIRYDARYEFKGDWTARVFDDSDWPTAKTLGKPPTAPWNKLYERPVPLGKEGAVKDYVNKSEIPDVSDGRPIVCQLPQKGTITPLLAVDAHEGYTVDMRTDQYLVDGEYGIRSEYVTKSGVQEYESLGIMRGNAVIYTMPVGVRILSLQYRETH